MSLLPFAQWIAHTSLGVAERKSTLVFPTVEVVHVLGLTLLLGSILAMDMRLLGAGLRRQSPAEVAAALSPMFWSGLGLALATGAILFIGEPVKCFFNEAFWWKMGLLVAALTFHFTLFRAVSRADAAAPLARRSAAIASLVLWFGVGVAGRVIGSI